VMLSRPESRCTLDSKQLNEGALASPKVLFIAVKDSACSFRNSFMALTVSAVFVFIFFSNSY
jgi:hypothetical protein